MAQGITAHAETLVARKIGAEFASALQQEVDACIALNKEQEALNARLKEKTAAFDAALAAMRRRTAEARKIIKIDIPQTLWREFGIDDKR
jgi:phospholipid N-methyltransferase